MVVSPTVCSVCPRIIWTKKKEPFCFFTRLQLFGVQLAQTDSGQFHFRRATFSSQLKSRVGLALA